MALEARRYRIKKIRTEARNWIRKPERVVPEEYRKSKAKREKLGKKLVVGFAVGYNTGVVQ